MSKKATATYKALMQKIAEHGWTEVEEIDLPFTHGRTIKRERTLIVLEMIYRKALEGNLQAAEYYLDRMLGRPKESLNLTNGADLIGEKSDQELISEIAGIIKSVRQRLDDKPDKDREGETGEPGN